MARTVRWTESATEDIDEAAKSIALENNLSETAFYVPTGNDYELRWFTPAAEVDLCGHATLASAHVLFTHEGFSGESISFHTKSGVLTVKRRNGGVEMSFPAKRPIPCVTPDALIDALGEMPLETLAADDYIAVFGSEDVVRALRPNMTQLDGLDLRGVVVTAPGSEAHFVSRFFAPKLGVPEDPVTGSAHCELAKYWGLRLNLTKMVAFQCSHRGGEVGCEISGDRVLLSGRAVTFMQAEICVET
jgi:PhzF family phenazine biosynthesis protein